VRVFLLPLLSGDKNGSKEERKLFERRRRRRIAVGIRERRRELAKE